MACLRRCLTTGVLNRNIATNVAHVEVANFTNETQRLIVTVYNWDVSPAAAIPGCMFNVEVPANTNVFLNCPLPNGVAHYEVRVNTPISEDVIVNVFGVTGGPTDPQNRANQEGNTVLFRDLVPICYNSCDFLACDN